MKDKKSRIIKYPLNNPPRYYTTEWGSRLSVAGLFNEIPREKLVEGKGYIYEGNIFKFTKNIPTHPSQFPLIYFKYDSDMNYTIETLEDMNGDFIPESKLKSNDFKSIMEKSRPDKKYDQDQQNPPSVSSNIVYEPVIGETDDFLKKIVKTLFLMKKTGTQRYKKMLTKSYAFSNLFQSLNNATKTSTTNWQTWMELLGIDAIMIIKDSGADKLTPIEDYLVYNSRNDKLDIVPKEDIKEYIDSKL